MSYPCKLIQDLLPLYHDGVCSDESREIISEHLSNCSECSEILKEIRSADSIENIRENKKNESLKIIKRKVFRKQIIIAVTALIAAAAVIFFGSFLLLSREYQPVNVGKLSVNMIDGDLVCRGNTGFPYLFHVKTVSVTNTDGTEEDYVLFSVYETKWDSIFSSKNRNSEMVVAYKDKGAQAIDRVYYYTGDDTEIEMLPEDELQKIIERSTLLWSRN